MKEKPVLSDEFESLLNKLGSFESNPVIALSLSGGCDSLALLYLLKEWILKKNGIIKTFIVDHGLRQNSKNEAMKVKKIVESYNISCRILRWLGPKPRTRIMEYARNERYKLITEACIEENILHLFLGHHLNDNIETFLMRSQRKGHKNGLSSIPSIREQNSIRIIRPLLDIEKNRLVKTCEFHNQRWIEDPSNFDEKFERVRVRKKKKNNEIINEIKNRIKFFTKKKYILEKKVSFFFSENLIFENYGVFKIKKDFFFKTNNEIQIEILKKILVTNSGFSYSPKLSSLKLIINNIRKNRNSKQTLHSSIIFVKDNLINICREGIGTQRNNPICLKVKSSNKILWDERFILETKKYDLTCEVINTFKWNSIKKLFFDKKKRKLPMLILKTLPLINNGNEKFIPFVNSKYYLKKNGINFYFSPRIPLTLN